MSRFRLAWIQIRSQIGQLVVAIVVISLGVGLSAGMLLANAALRESFEGSIDALAGRADLVVSPLSGGGMDESLLESVRALEGVEAAAPVLLGDGFLKGDDPLRLRIVGVDMLDDATVRIYETTPTEAAGIEDPLVFLSQQDSVIAPRELLRQRSLDLGSVIVVQTSVGERALTIRGVLEGRGIAKGSGGNLLVMDLYRAQGVLGAPGLISQIDIRAGAAHPTEDLKTRLRAALPAHVGVDAVSDRRAELSRSVAGFQAMLNVIAGMGLLLAVLITANRLATVYQERMCEIGILRGMGWSPSGLLYQLLAESSLLSALGAALGLPLGMLFSRIIVEPVADTMALNFQQTVAVSQLVNDPVALGVAALAGFLSGIVAAVLPARRAARLSIVALRVKHQGRDPSRERTWRAWARALLPGLATIAFVATLATSSSPVGGVAMVLIFAAGVFLLPTSLQLVGRWISPLLGPVAWVGVADQGRVAGRAVGAGLMLMAGLALVVWIGNTGASFERFIATEVSRARRADLLVDSAHQQIASSGNAPRLSESLVSAIGALSGVKATAGEVLEKVRDPEFGIWAIDTPRFLEPDFSGWPIERRPPQEELERVASGRAVFINEALARNLGVAAGRTLRIMSPSGSLEIAIAGVVRTPFISPKGDVVMSRDVFKRYWRQTAVNRIFVLAEKGYPLEGIRDSIQRGLGKDYHLRVSTIEEHAGWIAENVRRGFSFLDVMVGLTLLVVLIGTGDALAANVRERKREIATLRSIGVGPGAVAGMVLAQALAIGIAGSVLAMVVGIAASYSFVHGVLQGVLGWELQVYPSYGTALIGMAMGISACVIGSIVPALYAARLPISKALRYE
jgi:putative ABC transport system permease protein